MRNFVLLTVVLVVTAVPGCEYGAENLACNDDECVLTDMDAFKMHAEDRLRDLETRIDELQNKAAVASADIRDALHRDVEQLRQKKDEVRRKMTEMWQAGVDRRHERRERLEAALDDLRFGVEQAFSRFQQGTPTW